MTESWIERAILDQLTTHDRRYKHDYGGVERTTDDLVAACARLDAIAAGDGSDPPSIEQLLTEEAIFEPEVETALQTLQERGLIEREGERERPGPPLERGDFGTTTVWTPTVEGRAEARRIREAYADEVATLVEPHDESDLPEDVSDELVSLAKSYGVLPDPF